MSATTSLERRIRETLRPIKDYPKPGIVFQDITPVLADAALLQDVIAMMAQPFANSEVSHVVGIEARGFILGGAVANALRAGFVPVRKPGKLPSKTVKVTYDLEYGSDCLEMHCDAVEKGTRILVIDDLLATGGTAKATVELLKGQGADIVGVSFLIELVDLGGREKLAGENVSAVLQY